NSTIQITKTSAYEGSVHFTDFDTQVAYVKDKNLYKWNLKTGTTTQVTNFLKKEKKEKAKSEKDDWLNKDQLELFDVLRERKEKTDRHDTLMTRFDEKKPLKIYLEDKTILSQRM